MGTTNVRGAGPWALLAICMGYFMVILDTTIVNAALPALRTDLGADVTGLQWVVDGYMLVLAAGLLSGGALADLLGARRVCQWGLLAFVVASIACGAAPNLPVLIAARILQGVGAALAVPASLALLRAANPDRQARARAVGIWGGVAGGAAAAGPILGGLLVGLVGWESVFLVNVPIGLAACWLIARTVPAPAPRPRSLDLVGQVLAALALTALTVALIEHAHVGVAVVAAAVFLLAGAAFVLAERRAHDPMLPLGLFRDGTLSAGTAVGLLINLGFYGELFVLNLYLQEPRHLSALVAGLALLPQMGMAAIGSALSGRYTAATGGPRRTMLVGLLIGAAGLLGLMIAGLPVARPAAGRGRLRHVVHHARRDDRGHRRGPRRPRRPGRRGDQRRAPAGQRARSGHLGWFGRSWRGPGAGHARGSGRGRGGVLAGRCAHGGRRTPPRR
jgi:DHA2 family methylenomycin A resistance protein-like MFS transporter